MIHATHTIPRWLTALAALALPFALASCEMFAEMFPPGADPSQASEPQSEPDEAAPTAVEPNAPVGVLIHRLDMPLDVSLDACWSLVDETTVPPLTHGMWQANGMRIGVLHAEQAQAFADAMPTTLGESRAKLIGSPYPTAIRSTPRLLEPVPVDLTDPPRSPTIYRAIDGRLQLLAKVTRFPETGQPYVEIIPHHYKPKADLIPRSPLDKAMDGKIFTPLTARMPLTPVTAIVIGLHRPWPEPTESEPASEDEQPQTESTDTVEPASETGAETQTDPRSDKDQPFTISDQRSPQPPVIPESLGKSLMAGIRAGQETQIMIVITVIDE